MKKHLVRFLLGIAVVLFFLGHAAHLWRLPFVEALDAYLYDVRVRLFMANTQDDRIVIVDIDEKSLAEIGRWPWGRNVVSELVRKLTDEHRVAVVGFDVVFAEPDDSSGLKVLEQLGRRQLQNEPTYQKALQELRPQLDYDRLFAQTLRGRPVVLGYYFSNRDDAQKDGALPPPVFAPGAFSGMHQTFVAWKGFGANLKVLQEAAAGGGHFNPMFDFDGVTRRVPMLLEYQGAYYEALSLAVVRELLGNTQVRQGYEKGAREQGMEWLEVSNGKQLLTIPVDESTSVLVPYRGEEGSFRYVSAADVLKGRLPPGSLQGKIILVGTTAPGLKDLRATPVGGSYPGVEVHANLIAGMLDGNLKEKPGYVVGIDAAQILVFGCMLALLLPLLSPLRASMLTLATWAGLLGINFFLWNSAGLVLPLAAVLTVSVLLFALNMSWGYFVESKTKRQFTALFGQYVPPELVEEMAKDPENYSMEGRKDELTVLFSDVRSFTSISEGLDSKELTLLMNAYLGAMTAVIRGNRGTLDKYIGDAIMAFWGAPVADSEHARHAVLTALQMQQEIRKLDEPFRVRGWPELNIGVGVNTGMMTVGDMGSPVRQSYTVMGDTVNLGSRLEGITKEYGVGIVVGEATRAKTRDYFVYRELDRVRVKGKDEPVAIFEPLGAVGEVLQERLDELQLWHHALRAYRNQDWDQAEIQLVNLAQKSPSCQLYSLYLERIAHYRADSPGENWDGVTTFKTK